MCGWLVSLSVDGLAVQCMAVCIGPYSMQQAAYQHIAAHCAVDSFSFPESNIIGILATNVLYGVLFLVIFATMIGLGVYGFKLFKKIKEVSKVAGKMNAETRVRLPSHFSYQRRWEGHAATDGSGCNHTSVCLKCPAAGCNGRRTLTAIPWGLMAALYPAR